MSFYSCFNNKTKLNSVDGYSIDMLHRAQCAVCPLNHNSKLTHPHMEPSGAQDPIVYCLGEAPGGTEDEKGIPFVGPAGRVLRFRIPSEWRDHVRFNNCVRTRPPENRTPTQVELECCRPSVMADIEKTRPTAIFGFGVVPLQWALNRSGITNWCGRRVPLKIGEHTCWYFPMMHPSYILRGRRFTPRTTDEYGSDEEFKFALDLRLAFEFLQSEPATPVVHSKEGALDNLEIVTGHSSTDLQRVLYHLQAAALDGVVGLDYETNMLRPYHDSARILTIAVARNDVSLAFPLYHEGAGWSDQELGDLQDAFEQFLYATGVRKAVHHLPFEMEWSAEFYGTECLRAGKWGDSECQAYVLDERRGMHNLDVLCQQYFGLNLKAISNLNTKMLAQTPVDQVLRYNALDAKYHRLLYLEQAREIKKQDLSGVYRMLLERVPTMVLTQRKGVPVDQEQVEEFKKTYTEKRHAVEDEIDATPEGRKFYKMFEHHYRPGAPHDVTKMVTQILKTPDVKNVNQQTLNKIDHPIIYQTLRWRKANKILSTYILPVAADSPHVYSDGRIHPVISLTQTRTSRTCVRQGSMIQVPGGTKPIEQIRVGDFVYSYDQNKNLTLRKVTNTWFTGHKELVRIHWASQGGVQGYLDVTPDHRIRLVSGEYIRADQLQTSNSRGYCGDRILALHRGKIDYNMLYATGKKAIRENRFVFETVHGWSPEQVHHIDGDKYNDDPANLQGMTASDHHSHHNDKRVLTADEIIQAAKSGNGIVGAMQILQCDYETIKRNMDELRLSLTDGRKNRPVRPEQRKQRSPYKGHIEYVRGYQSPYENNHIVKSVTTLRGTYPVYDIEVRGCPCFIVNELCVSNSSEDPNVQNFPKRQTKEIRRVIAHPKLKVVSFDYGQIQARNVAMESEDKALIKAFWDRYDIHEDWMERIAKAYPSWMPKGADKETRKKFRHRAKNEFVFPSFFGAQPKALSRYLGVPEEVIAKQHHKFWEMFPDIKGWHQRVLDQYNRLGYVSGLTGFRRHAPATPNEIINAPIQADETAIVCDAMTRLSKMGDDRLQATLEIHDDLTFLWRENEVDELAEIVIATMISVPFEWARRVPIVVEMAVGPNWSDLSDAGVYSSDTWKKS